MGKVNDVVRVGVENLHVGKVEGDGHGPTDYPAHRAEPNRRLFPTGHLHFDIRVATPLGFVYTPLLSDK